jgi:hypothetical protein
MAWAAALDWYVLIDQLVTSSDAAGPLLTLGIETDLVDLRRVEAFPKPRRQKKK